MSGPCFALDSVETAFTRGSDATLRWMANGENAIFEWETADLTAEGKILFSQHDTLERDWVRHVCRSFEFSGECYSLPMKDDDVLALVDCEQLSPDVP